jgi:hypothetical protein
MPLCECENVCENVCEKRRRCRFGADESHSADLVVFPGPAALTVGYVDEVVGIRPVL